MLQTRYTFNDFQLIFVHFLFRKTDETFKVYVTIDIAADKNKISGNELRDILYNQAKVYQTFGTHTVDLKEFSITNLEGKMKILKK